jgi:large subunit ribosomal protein L18
VTSKTERAAHEAILPCAIRKKEKSMIPAVKRNETRQRIHVRIRRKVRGTAERPRMNVYRSLNHLYVQLIDDANGNTVVSASTSGKNSSTKTGGNLAAARELGKAVAQRAQEKGVKKVVFDRGGYLYHGRIKALADSAREAGLEF